MQIGHIFRAIARTAAAISVIVAAPVLAQEEDGVTILEPNSKWVVRNGEDSCQLYRTFGEGDDSSMLSFERYKPSDNFVMMVAGRPFKKLRQREQVEIQFGPSELVQEKRLYPREVAGFPHAFMLIALRIERPSWADLSPQEHREFFQKVARGEERIAPISEGREEAVNWLSISDSKKQKVRFSLGAMNKAFAALRACTDELMISYGVDPAAIATQLRAPWPANSPGEWITRKDYPSGILSAGHETTVKFRLNVNADGKPTACHIRGSNQPKVFHDIVCDRLMKRARFKPALNADGQPHPSYYQSAVKFAVSK